MVSICSELAMLPINTQATSGDKFSLDKFIITGLFIIQYDVDNPYVVT